MSIRVPATPRWIGVLDRVYAAALWLYPPAHRRRFGTEMRSAFGDRCREAARAGRGPWSVLLVELVPDLAATVGLEHFDEIHREAQPMKRLLVVLLIALAAVVVWRPSITPALDAFHAWNGHRQDLAHDRAYSHHLAALAQANAEHRRDSADDVVTAMLYRQAADGWDPASGQRVTAAIDNPAAAALRQRADAAFVRALKADDRWALWLAARRCPAAAATCQSSRSLARLEQLEPGNGAVWAVALTTALHAGDTAGARAALSRLAAADRFDSYGAPMTRRLLAAFDRLPVPAALPQHDDDDPAMALASGMASDTGYLFDEFRELKPFSDYCRSSDPSLRADRRADCGAAGRLIAERADLHFGYITWMRNADPGQVAVARAAFRDHDWRSWGYLAGRSQPVTWAMERARWLAANDGPAAARKQLAAWGFSVQPPTTYQLRPEQYDPWY